jgi:hypothetical protein
MRHAPGVNDVERVGWKGEAFGIRNRELRHCSVENKSGAGKVYSSHRQIDADKGVGLCSRPLEVIRAHSDSDFNHALTSGLVEFRKIKDVWLELVPRAFLGGQALAERFPLQINLTA